MLHVQNFLERKGYPEIIETQVESDEFKKMVSYSGHTKSRHQSSSGVNVFNCNGINLNFNNAGWKIIVSQREQRVYLFHKNGGNNIKIPFSQIPKQDGVFFVAPRNAREFLVGRTDILTDGKKGGLSAFGLMPSYTIVEKIDVRKL